MRITRVFSPLLAAALLSLALTVTVSANPVGPIVTPTTVTFQANQEQVQLIVSGPDGYRLDQIIAPGGTVELAIAAQGQQLADGQYRFEIRSDAKSSGPIRSLGQDLAVKQRGVLIVSDGRFVSAAEVAPESISVPAGPAAPAEVIHGEDVIIGGQLCVGNSCATGGAPATGMRFKEFDIRVDFDDTSSPSDSFPHNDWKIVINDSTSDGDAYFAIEDSTAMAVPFRLDAGAPTNSLRVDSKGRLGLGTAEPREAIHMRFGVPTILLEETIKGQTWAVGADDNEFAIADLTAFQSPFVLGRAAPTLSLVISTTGNVGSGILSPESSLHIVRKDGSARMHVEERSQSAGERTLALLSNKGATNLQFDNTDINRQWSVGVQSAGDFRIQSQQSISNAVNFEMDQDGSITLSGNLSVHSCIGCTSSRISGQSLTPDVLRRIGEVPIQRWRTRDASEHVVPDMSAFHSLTGLGLGPGAIAPLDVASVALASAQDQEMRIKLLETENQALRAELDLLSTRLAALEAAISDQIPAPSDTSEQLYLPSTSR